MRQDKVTVLTLQNMKKTKEKIAMVTCYDYSFAKILDSTLVDILLVGDSLGMVIMGYENTIPVNMYEIVHHIRAVLKGTTRAMVVADLPFLSYQISTSDAIRNAGLLLKTGAHGVKLEGGKEIVETISSLVHSGIPVMGHLGLTPQHLHRLGGYIIQGKNEESHRKLIEDALALEQAGVFSIVLEGIKTHVAREITEKLSVPTIGIGAGPYCDGQVLVLYDLLGLYGDITPKFVKRYAQLQETVKSAIEEFCKDVKEGSFPSKEHSY